MTDVPCQLTFGNCPQPVLIGDYLRGARTGYRVIEARLVRGHGDKWRLKCLRCAVNEIPPDARVFGLQWNKRNKKRR